MDFNLIKKDGITISEVVSEETIINNVQDILDLIVNAGAGWVLMYEHHFCEDFYRLRSKLLGEILQKLTNYRIKLAIIGEFKGYLTDNFSAFIRESNSTGDFLFLQSKDEAISRFTGK